MTRDLDNSGSSLMGALMLMLGAIVFAIIAFFICSVTIDANERGIKTRQGVIVSFLEPGMHWVTPFIESVHEFKVDNQRLDNARKPANTYTVDNQEVNASYELIYQLPADEAGLRYIVTDARNYEAQLDGAVINRMKIELGKVNANSLAQQRGAIVSTIEKELKAELLAAYKIKIINYRLLNVDYTQTFRDAVNKAAEAKAGIETEENKRLQAIKVADQVEEKAKGEAKAYKLKTDAEAAGHEAIGLAKAKALRAEGEALAANPRLVEYEQAKRWTGVLPHLMGVGAMPFMSIPGPDAPKSLDAGLPKR